MDGKRVKKLGSLHKLRFPIEKYGGGGSGEGGKQQQKLVEGGGGEEGKKKIEL